MFKVNVVLVFLLSTLNIFRTFFRVSIVEFEQVNVNWIIDQKYIHVMAVKLPGLFVDQNKLG